MAKDHHYSFGSGMVGCMYDYGPNFCEKKADAIESFADLFCDGIDDAEELAMREALASNGIYYFRDPANAGAAYAEIVRQPGPCPEGEP